MGSEMCIRDRISCMPCLQLTAHHFQYRAMNCGWDCSCVWETAVTTCGRQIVFMVFVFVGGTTHDACGMLLCSAALSNVKMLPQSTIADCCVVVSSRYSHSRATCARVSYTCATGGETHVPEASGATPPLVVMPACSAASKWLRSCQQCRARQGVAGVHLSQHHPPA